MPDFKSPKKTKKTTSVDGFISGQARRKIGVPTYYKKEKESTSGFIPAAKTKHRPYENDEHTVTDDLSDLEESTLSNNELDIFDTESAKESRNETTKRTGKKEKKHGKIRRFWSNRSRKFKVFFILFIILLGLAGAFGLRIYSFFNSVFSRGIGNASSAALADKPNADNLNTEGDGRLNVLLLGRGGTENVAPDLTDTIIIASIDLENKEASLLSIPRDTWVTVNGSSAKINATFANAKSASLRKGKNIADAEADGVRQTIDTVRGVAGVPIHKYVLTDYKAFRDVVNALGGITVNVPSTIYDGFTGWKFAAGSQNFNGDKALQYARSRHGSQRGDFDRSERQRQLLVAMRTKAASTGVLANPLKLNSLANAIQKNIRTDLSVDEIKTLYDKTKGLNDDKIVSLDLAKPNGPLVQTGNINGQSVVRPVAGLSDFSKIKAYARSNMLDPFLKKELPTIAIYNASGKSGLATSVADVMTSYGYKVLTKETSKINLSTTKVVRRTQNEKIFTERYLSKRFAIGITQEMPEGVVTESADANNSQSSAQPDYVIVIGSDFRATGPTW